MSETGSTTSLETIASEGCPVSVSYLYNQRELVRETLKSQGRRNAITEYRKQKRNSIVGKAKCLKHAESPVYHHSQTYRRRNSPSNLEMTFTCM